ncbi:MAG: XkdX family protein [Lactobacillus iners]|uniref:XkdX family protein n=1 Tax=Lactobacillales TaxID=186826 RepID=UPI0001E9BDF8|nr:MULTISPECIES: XkdX family protein [Lactobacillales]MCT7681808.1 XkdX family protein [Lactobacillus crispatus]EFQ50503.1 putative XkdX family protein [Lactobacillus iners LEAF 2062A-h1]MCT7677572.1 XkdX family protein [Lactobacillus iners]MCT7751954.1 XkdX family protein [Lactobacillus iners]MCT7764473.1 XkdX family protein [Lactobacillus iners]
MMSTEELYKQILINLYQILKVMSVQEVKQFVEVGAITTADFKEITGVEYVQ